MVQKHTYVLQVANDGHQLINVFDRSVFVNRALTSRLSGFSTERSRLGVDKSASPFPPDYLGKQWYLRESLGYIESSLLAKTLLIYTSNLLVKATCQTNVRSKIKGQRF